MTKKRDVRSVQVWCRVTPAQKAELERLAQLDDRSVSDLVYRALRLWLQDPRRGPA